MSYLVIVHVPYEVLTGSKDKLTEDKKPEKETKDEEKSNTAVGCDSDSKQLDTDSGKDDTEKTANLIDLTDITDVTLLAEKVLEEELVDEKALEKDKTEDENSVNTVDEEETEVTEIKDEAEQVEKMETPDECEVAAKVEEIQAEKEEIKEDISLHDEAPLTPLFQKIPIHERVEKVLTIMEVENVEKQIVGQGTFMRFSFVQEDSQRCEQILNKLRGIGVCLTAKTSISVFPSSLHETAKPDTESKASSQEASPAKSDENEEVEQKTSQFKKSVKSRLLVAQVVNSVTANAAFTFDYLLLLVLASLIACLGLAENSSVVLVASMLISPLMGPILAATFGQVIRKHDMRDLGLKSEIIGLAICLLVGFLFGLICGGVGLHGAIWGSTDSWPTIEMKSRGMLRSLWVGVLIALPSGAGVAISVLGGNAGSLVGVAISASLLPPACNAGMLWAYSLLAAIKPPEVEEISSYTQDPLTTTLSSTTYSVNVSGSSNTTAFMPGTTTVLPQLTAGNCPPLVNNKYTEVYFCNAAHEAAILGLVSLLLTLMNIFCIIAMGILVLKIKEVAPRSAGSDTFWREDVQVARGYYSTAKGERSKSLGKTFLEEYKRLQAQTRKIQMDKKDSDISEDSLDDDFATIEVHELLQEVHMKVAEELDNEYNQAAMHITNRLSRKPEVYLADHSIRDKEFQRVYNTVHNIQSSPHADLVEHRNTLKRRKAPSMYIHSSALLGMTDTEVVNPRQSRSNLGLSKPGSKLFGRRKQKVKFQVTKVEEEQELV